MLYLVYKGLNEETIYKTGQRVAAESKTIAKIWQDAGYKNVTPELIKAIGKVAVTPVMKKTGKGSMADCLSKEDCGDNCAPAFEACVLNSGNSGGDKGVNEMCRAEGCSQDVYNLISISGPDNWRPGDTSLVEPGDWKPGPGDSSLTDTPKTGHPRSIQILLVPTTGSQVRTSLILIAGSQQKATQLRHLIRREQSKKSHKAVDVDKICRKPPVTEQRVNINRLEEPSKLSLVASKNRRF